MAPFDPVAGGKTRQECAIDAAAGFRVQVLQGRIPLLREEELAAQDAKKALSPWLDKAPLVFCYMPEKVTFELDKLT